MSAAPAARARSPPSARPSATRVASATPRSVPSRPRSHDHNPLHHDLAAAKAAGYRALIASGTQLGSVFMAMTATHFAKPAPDGRPRLGLGMGFEHPLPRAGLRRRGHRPALDRHRRRWKESLAGWITRLEGDARSADRLLARAAPGRCSLACARARGSRR